MPKALSAASTTSPSHAAHAHDASHAQQPLRLTTDMAVVVSGSALTHVLGKKDMEQAFLTVARCCRAVIACRVSPQQKALIVGLVRKGVKPSPMTLAIGDGANDVGMIQRAQVGVGISGKEGLQAVNSADFAIAQFRFLRRLLLVHGRWDYRRMTRVVLYSFYKNVVITLSLFYFTALAGFSGTSFYESMVYTTYNFVLGLPIIFAGILDRDVSAKTALSHPSVYAVGLRYMDLNMRRISSWLTWAVLHSAIAFWFVYGIMGSASTALHTEGGWTMGSGAGTGGAEGLDAAGFTQFSVLVWAMQFEVCMNTTTWTRLNYAMLAISMAGFYLFVSVYTNLSSVSPQFYGVAFQVFASPNYWLTILLVLGVMMVVDYTTTLIGRMHFPTPTDIAMELDRGYGDGPRGKNGLLLWGDEDDGRHGGNTQAAVAAATGGGGGSPTASGGAAAAGGFSAITVGPSASARAAGAGSGQSSVRSITTPSLGPSTLAVPPTPTHGALSAPSPGGHIGHSDSIRLLPPSATGAAAPPPPPGLHISAPAGTATGGGSMHYSGYVDVPKEAILEGATPGARDRMGIASAGSRTGFMYSATEGRDVEGTTPYHAMIDSEGAALSGERDDDE